MRLLTTFVILAVCTVGALAVLAQEPGVWLWVLLLAGLLGMFVGLITTRTPSAHDEHAIRLRRDRETRRRRLAGAITEHGWVPETLPEIEGGDPRERLALFLSGTSPELIDLLLQVVALGDPTPTRDAIAELGRIGEPAREAVLRVREGAGSDLRIDCDLALRAIDEPEDPTVEADLADVFS